jgi:hypothetical protein
LVLFNGRAETRQIEVVCKGRAFVCVVIDAGDRIETDKAENELIRNVSGLRLARFPENILPFA